MLEALPSAALSGGVIAALFGFIAVRRAHYLEGKLAELRRMLWVELGMLAVFFLGLVVAGRTAIDGPSGLTVGQPVEASAVVALRLAANQALREHTMHLAGVGLVLMCLLPAVLHVLRELQSFVLAHRTDLLARDQAAAATAKR